MSGGVIVIVDQHGRANEVLARGTDAANARVLVAGVGAQSFFGFSDAFPPDMAGITQLDFIFADVEISGFLCRAGNDQAVITSRFQGRSEVAAGGSAA